MTNYFEEYEWIGRKITILSLLLVVSVGIPLPLSAQQQNVDYEQVRNDVIAVLELQYQISLSLPFSPMTAASLAAGDTAIAAVSTASVEELEVLRAAGLNDTALMSDLVSLSGAIQEHNNQFNSIGENNGNSSQDLFECDFDGYIDASDEFIRPPGPCKQVDNRVVGIENHRSDLFVDDGMLHLTDNVYPFPGYFLCPASVPPVVTGVLFKVAHGFEKIKFIADRACEQSIFFFASGGNCKICCIPTDLAYLQAKYISEGAQFCNDVRGASEGRTTYARAGELFVQSSGNTAYIDAALVAGFGEQNGKIGEIRQRACENTVQLNQAIEELDETLRSLRIDNARLLNLLGDQLDPINPIPTSVLNCDPASSSAIFSTESSLEPGTTVPPSSIPPPLPEVEVPLRILRGRNSSR